MNRVPSKAVQKTPFELWTNKKPSLRHLHVWGCPAEARIYNPHEKKLDSRTISGYFLGYPEKSKGYVFYCPNHSPRIVETGNARFIENGEVSGSTRREIVEIKETRVNVTLPRIVPPSTITPNVVPAVVEQHDDNEQHINEEVLPEGNDLHNADMHEPQKVALRRPQRNRRSAISNDYVVYMQESDYDIGINKDPVSFSHAVESKESKEWINAMKEELKSMQ